MTKELVNQHTNLFEQIKQTDENGNEFWSARDLSKALEYSEYRHFLPVIDRAKEACINSGQQVSDHFEDILEMINIGKTARREVKSVKLSRYACYLIVQNADSNKEAVAVLQSYSANQMDEKSLRHSAIMNYIYRIDGIHFMLDKDLAVLYQTETRTLKQAVKRNIERFPSDFMFELSDKQIDSMVSQFVIPSKGYFGGAKPFAFTEQGVAMLSSVLKTKVAIEVSIQIIRAFIEMRKLITNNVLVHQRLDRIENKQIETDHKFEQVFKALEQNNNKPRQGVFFNGQTFDAYVFVAELIKKAKNDIILIDNYVDETVLTLLAKRNKNVTVTIYTKNISKQLQLDLNKYNSQYPEIQVVEFTDAHDRFLILDKVELYHLGASLKDLGKKWFAFSKMEGITEVILTNLTKIKLSE